MKVLLSLSEKKPEEKRAAPSKKGGRGRKECPTCLFYVGVRTKVCNCGHNFLSKGASPKQTKIVPKKKKEKEKPKVYQNRIIVPAGKCPVKLDVESLTRESIRGWAAKVRAKFGESGDFLFAEGIVYYSREYVYTCSDKYNYIKEVVNEWDAEISGDGGCPRI